MILLHIKVDSLEIHNIVWRRHFCEGSILNILIILECNRLDLMLLAVLNIDPELCLSAEGGVNDEAAHDWLGVCTQVELLVDGDGMV